MFLQFHLKPPGEQLHLITPFPTMSIMLWGPRSICAISKGGTYSSSMHLSRKCVLGLRLRESGPLTLKSASKSLFRIALVVMMCTLKLTARSAPPLQSVNHRKKLPWMSFSWRELHVSILLTNALLGQNRRYSEDINIFPNNSFQKNSSSPPLFTACHIRLWRIQQ